MAIYSRGVPVRVVEGGVAVTLTSERLAADVVDQVGGASVLVGPQGPAGQPGAPGTPGTGVPAGGTTGQLLAKSSSADYATGWVAAPSSTVGFATTGAARPSGYAVVIWMGGLPPLDAVAGDIWVRTS